MQSIFRLVMVFAIAGLSVLFACSNENRPENAAPEVNASDVKEEAEEAVGAAATFTQQQKDEYMQMVEEKMSKWEQQIADLQAQAKSKASELTKEGKALLNQQLETLRSKKEVAAEKYEEFKFAGGRNWEELKAGMDTAMEDLRQAFSDIQARFGENN